MEPLVNDISSALNTDMECNHLLRFKVIVTICLKKGMFPGNDSSTTTKKASKNMMILVQMIMPREVDGGTLTHGNKGQSTAAASSVHCSGAVLPR